MGEGAVMSLLFFVTIYFFSIEVCSSDKWCLGSIVDSSEAASVRT